MTVFIERKVNPASKSARRSILGVGVNDAPYKISFNGALCPYYLKWANMIDRCYSRKIQKIQPWYSDCYVCDEWLIFSNFKKWMTKQDWKGKALDKDILIQGSKVYSPDTCFFIPTYLNNLLIQKKESKRKRLSGVSYDPRTKRFMASCSIYSKQLHVGCFGTEIEAHEAYKKVKYAHIRRVAEDFQEPIKSALLRWEIK